MHIDGFQSNDISNILGEPYYFVNQVIQLYDFQSIIIPGQRGKKSILKFKYYETLNEYVLINIGKVITLNDMKNF